MPWKKSPPELADLLADALALFDCRRKVMFGYPAYFVNDNMFAALHEDHVILRLPQPDRESLKARYAQATQFEPMPGRPMREYVVVPERLYRDADAFAPWIERSYRHAESLPPKAGTTKGRKGKRG